MKKKKIALALGASIAASGSLLAATSSERYVYDASGNIVEKQIGEQVTQLEYDGNYLKGTLRGNTQKRYQHDGAGRLVGELQNGQVARRLTYQFADKVTKVQSGDSFTELYYNAEGQLVGSNSSGTIEAFSWDGLAMVSRGEKAYANEEHVVGGVPALVGNEVAVSDIIGTTLSIGQKSFLASSFGEGIKEGLFTGKPYVEALEGIVFKFRNFDSTNNRWMSPDPSGFPDGANNHVYVNSCPTTSVDPTGLAELPAEIPSFAGICVLGGKLTTSILPADPPPTEWGGLLIWNNPACSVSIQDQPGWIGEVNSGGNLDWLGTPTLHNSVASIHDLSWTLDYFSSDRKHLITKGAVNATLKDTTLVQGGLVGSGTVTVMDFQAEPVCKVREL